MKKLLLLRHAKSDKGNPSIPDFDRPINGRGQKAASLIGNYIGKENLKPELVLSSPAERAKQTALLAIEASGIKTKLRFDEKIYEASTSQLLTVVNQIEDKVAFAMLVGHNPGFEDLLNALTGHAQHMPTAALAYLTIDVESWGDVRERSAVLEWMIRPKDLAANGD